MMKYHSALEKKTLPSATTYMKLEGIVLSEISQTKKHKYNVISLICGIYKKKKNESQTQRNRE